MLVLRFLLFCGFAGLHFAIAVGWELRCVRICGLVVIAFYAVGCRWRPYRVECTGSLPTSEVKRRRARLVLGWGTAREDLRVLPAFVFGLAAFRLDLGVGAAFPSVCGFAGLRVCASQTRLAGSCGVHVFTAWWWLLFLLSVVACGHTVSKAPDLFRPLKLSGAGPG